MKANRKIHYCLRGLLFIALSSYFFDECFLLEILCAWLSHHGQTSRAGPHVTALSMVPTAILMGAVGGQEELSLGGHSEFQRELYLPGARGSHWLQSSAFPRPWAESSSGGTNNDRHWVAHLRNIPCSVSSHTAHCKFVPWMCLPTSVLAWLTAQTETHSPVSQQPHPLLASGSSLSLDYIRPSWESWSPKKAASLPVESHLWKRWQGRDLQAISVSFARSYSTSPAAQSEVAQHSKETEHSTQNRQDGLPVQLLVP